MSGTTENVSLRGSHFVLGHAPDNFFKTNAQLSFKHPDDHGEYREKNVIDTAKLQSSHFQLGKCESTGFYNTTHNSRYPIWHDAKNAELSEEKKKDLRSHHFQMGTYGPTINTTNDLVYTSKESQSSRDLERQKEKMRGHHHTFKEQDSKCFGSTYDKDFSKVDNEALKEGFDYQKLQDKVCNLRSSHIILGKEVVPMKTTHQRFYNEKPESAAKTFQAKFQQTHFSLGVEQKKAR